MPKQVLTKAAVVWAAILLVAILNGALRDAFLTNLIGPTASRFLSGIALCSVILFVAVLTARWFGELPLGPRWCIGALWLFLTLSFEVSVGYAQHQSWKPLLDAYTFKDGNLWPFVLVTILIAPWLGARVRGIT